MHVFHAQRTLLANLQRATTARCQSALLHRVSAHVGKHGNLLANALLAGCVVGVAWEQLQQKYSHEREVAQQDEKLSAARWEKLRWNALLKYTSLTNGGHDETAGVLPCKLHVSMCKGHALNSMYLRAWTKHSVACTQSV